MEFSIIVNLATYIVTVVIHVMFSYICLCFNVASNGYISMPNFNVIVYFKSWEND